MSTANPNGPAFPVPGMPLPDGSFVYPDGGVTLHQYAAITLRVPESGTQWLDDMIRKSLRDEMAAKAMQGFAADPAMAAVSASRISEAAYMWADAMLQERAK